jgi:hypothetical protein
VKRRSHIALVAIFALAIHSLGLCSGTGAACSSSVCAGHHQDCSCPQHPHRSEHESRHLCCVSTICWRGAELAAGKDSSVSDVLMLAPVVFTLPSIDLAQSLARSAALAWVHAPPLQVPIFLSIRTLLI